MMSYVAAVSKPVEIWGHRGRRKERGERRAVGVSLRADVVWSSRTCINSIYLSV
jgi:hypothetical protein